MTEEDAFRIPDGINTSEDGLYKYKKTSSIYDSWDPDDGGPPIYVVELTIVKYLGEDNLPENYTIPNTIDGYHVETVKRGALFNLSSLVNVSGTASMEEKAIYNCKNLKSFNAKSSSMILSNKAVGFTKDKLNKGFKLIVNENETQNSIYHDSMFEYAYESGCKAIFNTNSEYSDYGQENIPYVQTYKSSINIPGEEFYCKVDGKAVTGWKSSNPKVIKITKDGKAAILKKGTATLEITVDGKKICRTFVIKYNPYFKKSTAKYSDIIDSVSVKKGKTASVYLFGKVNSINNKYTNTKTAKIVSAKSAKNLKIKGLKRGTTTLKVKVNGVKTLKLKVKVK